MKYGEGVAAKKTGAERREHTKAPALPEFLYEI
jgi:hypothetical protein